MPTLVRQCPMCGGSGQVEEKMGRRPNGAGSVFFTRWSNRWGVAVRINGKRVVRYRKTRAQAEQLLPEMLQEASQN